MEVFLKNNNMLAPITDTLHIFHADTEEEYLAAITAAGENVADFLQHTQKPFSGIKPAALLAQFNDVDFDTPLADYESLFEEVNRLYIKHATAFHLPPIHCASELPGGYTCAGCGSDYQCH
jgi:L-2,4-diaminobutyrate decarboxylase